MHNPFSRGRRISILRHTRSDEAKRGVALNARTEAASASMTRGGDGMHAISRRATTRQRMNARELAWALERMCAVGLLTRASGRCVGELRPRDVMLTPAGVRRRGTPALLKTRRHRRRAARHLARGHDAGCRAVGIPIGTVSRLLRAWGDHEGVQYLEEAFHEIVDELGAVHANDEWSLIRAAETVEYTIGGRITPRAPTGRPRHMPEGRATRV